MAERIIREAEFNPRVRKYWLLGGALILLFTVVGIPLLPLWFAFGLWATGKYLERMGCTLTDRSLKVRKGLLVRIEKTVPLDKITDVGMVQGPIMRYMDLEAISVETAGQSSQGALIRMTGIVDTRGFRDAVLAQRDAVVASLAETGSPAEHGVTGAASPRADALLEEIRDTLGRIEQKLVSDGRTLSDGP